MPGFRRAQLRGSEQLFQSGDPVPVRPEQTELSTGTPQGITTVEGRPGDAPVSRSSASDGRAVRLSVAELHLLAEAVQHVKFPAKPIARPSVDDFQRLEELRQRLLAAI